MLEITPTSFFTENKDVKITDLCSPNKFIITPSDNYYHIKSVNGSFIKNLDAVILELFEQENHKLKEAAIKLREAQNALVKCQDRVVRRQIAINVVSLQNSFDKMIGLKP